jgi:predicted phage tail protein
VLLAVVAVIVFFTGEPAEEAVEYLAGVSHDVVERHEEAALVATVGMGVLGAAALLVLFWFRRHIVPRALVMTSLLATLGLSGVMGYVANLGGQIRHTEIAGGGAPDNDRVDDHDRR